LEIATTPVRDLAEEPVGVEEIAAVVQVGLNLQKKEGGIDDFGAEEEVSLGVEEILKTEEEISSPVSFSFDVDEKEFVIDHELLQRIEGILDDDHHAELVELVQEEEHLMEKHAEVEAACDDHFSAPPPPPYPAPPSPSVLITGTLPQTLLSNTLPGTGTGNSLRAGELNDPREEQRTQVGGSGAITVFAGPDDPADPLVGLSIGRRHSDDFFTKAWLRSIEGDEKALKIQNMLEVKESEESDVSASSSSGRK